ncbi:MAG: NAD(P)/FAD-dependent oxidoreductase [Spirochaetales bacterium]|jgi:NADPH-dependent 2,4-dienoyl-CoA reductase/sulfur reductase-like enzyme|nr:NAD(P)/FAD-dependent oxidoreductase [Spirochaetales bacterium]
MSQRVDVAVIGGGPAGLAAAAAAQRAGASTLLAEREARLGGILKQCIHDGFGLLRFGEKLSGPEYAYRFIRNLGETPVEVRLQTFVSRIRKIPGGREGSGGFQLTLVSSRGLETLTAGALVLATGCRERTARQGGIHGTRPAGVLTAGTAQYYINILGRLPARRCVILGSGDIGLIMARRLTLEGAEVLGVYEAKSAPSGLSRNLAQCLEDFDIPLYTRRTVSRVFGSPRLREVEVTPADDQMNPLPGGERIPCDGLILSLGLIPENELAETLEVPLHPATRGPICDQRYMTRVPGVFSCGNALHVNDLVDYVSESGEAAGRGAAAWALEGGRTKGGWAELVPDGNFLSLVPQRLDLSDPEQRAALFFRSRQERGKSRVILRLGQKELFRRQFNQLRPPEMERFNLSWQGAEIKEGDTIQAILEPVGEEK